MFALAVGAYPQLAFGMANRVTVHASFGAALLLTYPARRAWSAGALAALLTFSTLGLSDHWRAWRRVQDDTIAALRRDSALASGQLGTDTLFVTGNAEVERRVCRAAPRQAGADHLVALAHARREKRQKQRRGAGIDGHDVRRAHEIGELALERERLGPHSDPAGAQHPDERLLLLVGEIGAAEGKVRSAHHLGVHRGPSRDSRMPDSIIAPRDRFYYHRTKSVLAC
jgi:hypothetical protein